MRATGSGASSPPAERGASSVEYALIVFAVAATIVVALFALGPPVYGLFDSTDWVVHVRPELVVEVAFDGVQTSPRYPGGMALRFARVLRHRPDKTAAEADSVDAVRAIHGR